MKSVFLITTILFTSFICFAQNRNEDYVLYDEIKTKPMFTGGEMEMYKFIGRNYIYPEDAKRELIEGRVIVSFLIRKTGVIDDTSVKVVQSLWPSCDDEAMRIVKAFPDWLPGKDDNGYTKDVLVKLPFIVRMNIPGEYNEYAYMKERRERKEVKRLEKEERERWKKEKKKAKNQ